MGESSFSHRITICLSGISQGSILVYFMFYVIVRKAFAENSRLTSLQRFEARRVVSLSSCYFLQNPFLQKGCWGSCGYGSCLKNIHFLSITRGCCSTLSTPLPASLSVPEQWEQMMLTSGLVSAEHVLRSEHECPICPLGIGLDMAKTQCLTTLE